MNLNLQSSKSKHRPAGRLGAAHSSLSTLHSPTSAVALVITLLMLSVITFLAVAFLAVTRRDREAVNSTLDQGDARSMQEVALARAQAEIIAHMQAHGDTNSYEFFSSHNYINPNGFDASQPLNVVDTNNVNYDFISSTGLPLNASNWVQNIANLLYDPRAPVFVPTNRAGSNDFRFWIDLNRNGVFETNGYLPVIGDNGLPLAPNGISTTTPPFMTNYFDGEPEWIGLLRNPEVPHSSSNRFIGRYAYCVLPIGKTLDINYIHNHTQGNQLGNDGYLRNQGFGSWELNLGGYLADLNTNLWNPPNFNGYAYHVSPNFSFAANDAASVLGFRYNNSLANLASAQNFFNAGGTNIFTNFDGYSSGNLYYATPTNYFNPENQPWSGSDNPNSYYNLLDEMFDPNRAPALTARMINAVNATNGLTPSSYNRYTFQRLLATLGTDSAPDLQTVVHGNILTSNYNAVIDPANLILRTKVNLNWSNTNEIAHTLNASPTNLVRWTPTNFFLNAADLLLRSQIFTITNQNFGNNSAVLVNYATFGVTNIPIYCSTNNGIRYNSQIHRLLQLAANTFDAINDSNSIVPHVFRPQFYQTISNSVTNVFITNFVEVVDVDKLPSTPYKPITTNGITTEDNIWGIPWIIGARKGLPNFNEYSFNTLYQMTRKLEVLRQSNSLPYLTNEMYIIGITNLFGCEQWNPYSQPFIRQVEYRFTNIVEITILTNSTTSILTTNTGATNYFPTQTNLIMTGFNPSKAMFGNFYLPFVITNTVVPLSRFLRTPDAGPNYFRLIPSGSSDSWETGNGFPSPDLVINITNRLVFMVIDRTSGSSGRILDYVNLDGLGSVINVDQILNRSNNFSGLTSSQNGPTALNTVWLTNMNALNIPAGIQSQMDIADGRAMVSSKDWNSYNTPGAGLTNDTTTFLNFLTNSVWTNDTTYVRNAPFAPMVTFVQRRSFQVNDPLVHYTLDDLTDPKVFKSGQSNVVEFYNSVQVATNGGGGLTDAQSHHYNLGRINDRYQPWDSSSDADSVQAEDMLFKDPLVKFADIWNFPTNQFPSIGWLGRVHRGTPWQTFFLKADPNPNLITWTNAWVVSPATYPTSDWPLLDLFTVSPNDNASRGLLSINQANSAAWAALFSGVIVLTDGAGASVTLDPTNVSALLNTTTNANNVVAKGINVVRQAQTNGVFHSIGDILAVPALTSFSPFLGGSTNTSSAFTDDVVERIPQQILSLLKVGQPRFVIYAYGQSLKPKDIYLGNPNFNLCTNYAITGEFMTRTVCHVEGDVNHPKVVVDNFNVLTGD